LPLLYLQPNGTLLYIDNNSHNIKNRCAVTANENCGWGTAILDAIKGKLVYAVDLSWHSNSTEGAIPNLTFVDAINGNVVWSTISYNNSIKTLTGQTSKELLQEKTRLLNPPEEMKIVIPVNASIRSQNVTFDSKDVTGVLGISNKISIINNDHVDHWIAIAPVDNTTNVIIANASNFKEDDEAVQIPSNSTTQFAILHEGIYSYHSELSPWLNGTITIKKNFS
jgi:hypothetical protein